MSEPSIAALIERLRSADASFAWRQFLDQYTPVLYHTARACSRDEDECADCFLYICEELAKSDFRRLRQFREDGAASFVTWLRVVARNLCVDRMRRDYGRPRPFRSVEKLSGLELEVYKCRHERGFSQERTLHEIRSSYPGVNVSQLNEVESRIDKSLSPRQHWILSTRHRLSFDPIISAALEDGGEATADIADERPSQETIVVQQQLQEKVQQCLASLPSDERLIVQLRFIEDLSLDEISRLTGLGGPQRVHRRLAAILQKLRAVIAVTNYRKTGNCVRKVTQETE